MSDPHIRIGQTYFPSKLPGISKKGTSPTGHKPFQQWLDDTLVKNTASSPVKPIHFSQHALNRLESRGIQLQESHIRRLESAVNKAEAKGCKESLVLMDGVAFVVNITNRKVITAVDEVNMKENIFTNIDSALFI